MTVRASSKRVGPERHAKGATMTLKIEYVRKSGELIASVTKGFSDGSTTVRDRNGRILGHTSDRFSTTRDAVGRLVSTNSASPGLLIKKK
jgi:hypothetical protein